MKTILVTIAILLVTLTSCNKEKLASLEKQVSEYKTTVKRLELENTSINSRTKETISSLKKENNFFEQQLNNLNRPEEYWEVYINDKDHLVFRRQIKDELILQELYLYKDDQSVDILYSENKVIKASGRSESSVRVYLNREGTFFNRTPEGEYSSYQSHEEGVLGTRKGIDLISKLLLSKNKRIYMSEEAKKLSMRIEEVLLDYY
ncbi:MAG: hypothetical protein PF542_05585 [Nanoarchaeota archaeon]|jgi:predicted nuclease with TOPRIM domain|nr:hypothetical protein [Nanoarchaeota archaeon]